MLAGTVAFEVTEQCAVEGQVWIRQPAALQLLSSAEQRNNIRVVCACVRRCRGCARGCDGSWA
jgi:hypothetical protein